MPVAIENPVTNEGVTLGRFLFYDPILSGDSTISCSTCHNQQNAFSDAPNRYSKGIYNNNTFRNTPPLFNLAWYPAFFWDGRATSLENQVLHPVRDPNEMRLPWRIATKKIEKSNFYKPLFKRAFGNIQIDSIVISKAIAQFLRTIISSGSKYDRALMNKDSLTNDEFEGLELINNMTKGDCLHCHTTDSDALGTTLTFSNNGLDSDTSIRDIGLASYTNKATDRGKFKIPSLRNLAFTAPYMHDGRFNTLEEVLEFYSSGVKFNQTIDPKMQHAHKGGAHLTKIEKDKIIAFLYTLTDSILIRNPEYSNPFVKN